MREVRPRGIARTLTHPVLLLSGVAVALMSLWITFTATTKLHELLIGSCATAVTLALLLNVLRTEGLQFRLLFRDLLLIRQVPAAILKDCGVLIGVLYRELTGTAVAGSYYRACGFRASTQDPVVIGRSALAIAYTTASPNMMVIGIDPAQSLMVFHQLKRDAVPSYARALGAAGEPAPQQPQTIGAAR